MPPRRRPLQQKVRNTCSDRRPCGKVEEEATETAAPAVVREKLIKFESKMKSLFFCNLRPDKVGAFERVLAELGREHRRHGDRIVLVLAGEPIPAVAGQFREAGVDWHVLPGWVKVWEVGGCWEWSAVSE